ncbi:hypothetical protein K438DRAFT_2123418 [Mycena galopus ATCC 62051]|nr:hypothetical protein K438DRAFT_2123418 [Mycena galopus ATCC 62051]
MATLCPMRFESLSRNSIASASTALFVDTMLWLLLACKTCSSTKFSVFSLPKDITILPPVVAALQVSDFNIAPLVTKAVLSETDSQNDCDSEGDDNVPDLSATDPWDDIDDVGPMPLSPTSASKMQLCSPTFDQVITSIKTPHTGPHRCCAPNPALKGKDTQCAKSHITAKLCCANKHVRNLEKSSHVPTAATADMHIKLPVPIAINLHPPHCSQRIHFQGPTVAEMLQKHF